LPRCSRGLVGVMARRYLYRDTKSRY
jgi:hypothetical protein